jgi:hypothetical protein
MAADRLHSRSLQLECAGPSYRLRVDMNLRSMVWYQWTTKGRTHVSFSLLCRLVCLRCQQLNLASISGSSRLLVSSLVASLAGSALKPRNTVLSCVLSRVSRVGGQYPSTMMSIVRAAKRRRRDRSIQRIGMQLHFGRNHGCVRRKHANNNGKQHR